jgi:preprotein translocase subunit YajC
LASANWFQPNAAPGRTGTSAPSTSSEGQPPPASGPEAPPAPFGGFSFLILALPLLLFFFLTTQSQNKKQKQLEASLKVGDRVFTQSGIIGKLIEYSPNLTRAKLEIAPGVNVQVLKNTIQGVDTGDAPADAKAAEKAKESAAKDKPQEKKS